MALDISTSPAPGTGYRNDSWWRDPLADLFQGATGRLEDVLGIDGEPLPPPPPLRAGMLATPAVGIPAGVLIVAGVGLLWWLGRGIRR